MPRKHVGGEVIAPPFLTSALDGSKWLSSFSGCLTPGGMALSTHWLKGCVNLRVDLDDAEKRKILPLPGYGSNYPAYHYTNSAIQDSDARILITDTCSIRTHLSTSIWTVHTFQHCGSLHDILVIFLYKTLC